MSARLDEHFKVNYEDAKSKDEAIIRGQNYRITVLSDILLRLEYDSEGIFEDRPTELAINRNFAVPEFEIKQDHKYLNIKTKYLSLEYIKEKPFAGPVYSPDINLKVTLLNTDKLWYLNHPEARNFLGSSVSFDGEVSKKNLKNGLYSTDGFASIDDSMSMLIEEDGMFVKRQRKTIDTYLFVYRRDFGCCLRDYFNLTGKPPLIPRYALGIWWNKDEMYSDYNIKELVRAFNFYEIPISTVVLGDTWHFKDRQDLAKFKTGFTFNPQRFPNPSEFIEYLHNRGIRLGINIDPRDGIMPHEEHYNNFIEGLQFNGQNVTIPFNPLDRFIMSGYLNKLIEPLNQKGVDFYWIDYKETAQYLRALNYFHFRNYSKSPEKRGMILSRNGTIAGHRYPVHYSGETIVSWKTLEYLPFYNSTASNIGLSWWSHDIGGFKYGVEDPELYVRYVQLGTFSPIFRFASKSGRYYKREPWAWDIKTYSISKEYCNLRHRLIPYIYAEAFKYATTGLPIVQPLYYQYPEIYDEPYYKNQYYFGSELFIAPITSKKDLVMNRSVERIYLPEGIWYDFKTGKKFPGNKRYVLFFKDEEYPVFARSGAIIPLADLEENRNVTSPPSNMEIHIFPGRSSHYNLYEDDGYTSLYEQGYYIKTKIDYNYLANNYTVIIRPLEGKAGIIPEYRNYRIRFRNVKESNDVTAYVEANSVPVTTYADGTDFIVEVDAIPTVKQLTINCKGDNIEIDALKIINEDIDSIITDLQIQTFLKEKISKIIFSDIPIAKKRIKIRQLKREGLKPLFVRMFLKLLEYIAEV